MTCKFYGCAAVRLVKALVRTGGNRCALITDAHAPCRMEAQGKLPILEECELNGSRAALDIAAYERVEMQKAFTR